jgi:hypothetical protein
MVVPPGFPNDSYRIGVSSGERVNVSRGGNMPPINITQTFNGADSTPERYKEIMYQVISEVISEAGKQ